MKQSRYIEAIDSLRAISVLAVIVYHFLPDIGGAGYLGVDAFFVISGFVIAASLSNYPTPQGMQAFLARFYLRRLKRLLPALIFVVVITSILTVLFVSKSQSSLKTGAFSVVGLANIHLYLEASDYFGFTSELNPFTHMWSLAVEDQFYLFFPILVWGFGNRTAPILDAERLLKPVVVISAISLAAFLAIRSVDSSFAFYMMPTRLWEIGAGIAAYLLASRHRYPITVRMGVIHVGIMGMLLTLSFGYLAQTVAHISITFFTAVALIGVWHDKTQVRYLNTPLGSYIGKLSYSLYLWHWPLIILAKHTVGINAWSVGICLLLTFGLASFSYHFIEIPFRHKRPLPPEEKLVPHFRLWMGAGIGVCALLLVALPRYASTYNNVVSTLFGMPPAPAQVMHRCHGKARMASFENPLEACLGGERTNDKPKKLFLIGDSHGNHLIPMIQDVIQSSQFSLHFANYESKSFGIMGMIENVPSRPEDIQYVLQNSRPGDIVAISFHRGRLNTNFDHHLPLAQQVSGNEQTENLITNLSPLAEELNEKNVNLLLLLDTPLLASVTTAETCAFQAKINGTSDCAIHRQQDEHTRSRQRMVYDAIQKQVPAVVIWDPFQTIYSNSDVFDAVDAQGDYLMYDWNHVTQKTLDWLKSSFQLKLDQLIETTKTR